MSTSLDSKEVSTRAEATEAEWVEVATVQELSRRKRKLVTAGAEEIALFLVDETVYALRDVCIHKGRQLSKGTLLHGRVICPGHQWQFDLETGWVSSQERCQPTYEVKVEDGTIYVNPEQRIRTEPPNGSEE